MQRFVVEVRDGTWTVLEDRAKLVDVGLLFYVGGGVNSEEAADVIVAALAAPEQT